MRAVKNLSMLFIIMLMFTKPGISQFDTINITETNIITKNDIKVGVLKNTNLVKIEVKGDAEIINLKDLESILGTTSLNRTYRTIASIENVNIVKDTTKIVGEALVIVISGDGGIILIFADMKNRSNYMYTGMKQNIVRKGEPKNFYHSQEDGIQRPDLVSILKEGIAWVSYGKDDKFNLNYVPFFSEINFIYF